MNLKTDYKNDIFSGKRKYHMTNNDDGTISLDDVTTYVQEGDILSADDVNATNKAVNELRTGSDSCQPDRYCYFFQDTAVIHNNNQLLILFKPSICQQILPCGKQLD